MALYCLPERHEILNCFHPKAETVSESIGTEGTAVICLGGSEKEMIYMKKALLFSLLALLAVGCALTQATRKAQYLSDNYSDQVQKSITIVSLIDARPDKTKDTQELLSNKNLLSYFISNPLAGKGYKPLFLDTDTSKCGSLFGVDNIDEIVCLNNEVFKNADTLLIVSIDKYIAPQGMRIAGNTKVTGVLYSKSSNSLVWKDSVEGKHGGVGMYTGLAAYPAMLMLKGMSTDFTFRMNVLNAIHKLLDSVPPLPKKK